MENVLTNGLCEMSQDEMFMIEGGDAARQSMMKATCSGGGVRYSEADKKLAVSYTLGYLSLATCWSLPLGVAFGAASTLYSIS